MSYLTSVVVLVKRSSIENKTLNLRVYNRVQSIYLHTFVIAFLYQCVHITSYIFVSSLFCPHWPHRSWTLTRNTYM